MDTTYSRGSPAGKPLQMAVQKEICVSPVVINKAGSGAGKMPTPQEKSLIVGWASCPSYK